MTSSDDFDWDAYHRDTRCLSPDARGAWWDCLYQQRLSPIRGRITMPVTSYARIFGASPTEAKRLLDEIATHGVGNVVTEANGNVTVTNRRMFRQWQEREGNKHRQATFRERHARGEHNEKVTNAEKNALLLLEEKSKKLDKKEKKKRVEGTRIPESFPLTDEMIGWASENCPDLDVITAHADFVEYWTNLTSAKAEKVDWRLTWQKGMRLALKWQIEEKKNGTHQKPNGRGYQPKPTPAETIFAREYYRDPDEQTQGNG